MNDWALYKLNDLINIYGSTLILIGSASSKTGFHLDWGSAKNWGVYLGSTSTQDPIAVWWLLHPTKLKDFLNIIKKVNLKGSAFSTSHDKLFEMQQKIGFDEAGRPFMEVKYQYSGDLIHIPVGWAHGVINLQVIDV